MRGLYASVTLQTEKYRKYAGDIEQLKTKLEYAKERLKDEQKKLQDYREQHSEHMEQIATFEKYIQEQRRKIEELSMTYMSIPEAKARLHSIQ